MELSLTQLNERFTKPLLELLQEGYLLRPVKQAKYTQGVFLEKGEEKFALVSRRDEYVCPTQHDIVLVHLTHEIDLRNFKAGTLDLWREYKELSSPIVATYDTYYSVYFPNPSYWEEDIIRYYDKKEEADEIEKKRYRRRKWKEFQKAGVLFTFKFEKTPWKGLRRNVMVEVTENHYILTNRNGKKVYVYKRINSDKLVRA